MNKRLWPALVASALSSGCAMHVHSQHPGAGNHLMPAITIKGDVVSVSPDPLVFRKDEGAVSITWRLPPGYTFAEQGIRIDGRIVEPAKAAGARPVLDPNQDEVICPRAGNGNVFTCVNRNRAPGAYKYTIQVMQDGKPLPARDPEIMNIN